MKCSLAGNHAGEKTDAPFLVQQHHEIETIDWRTRSLPAIALAGWFVWRLMHTADDEQPLTAEETPAETTGLLTLSEHKRSIAGIKIESVKLSDLQLTRTLPARFIYDDKRHISLTVPTKGVLQSVMLQPGDSVTVGQPVAVLQSPEIGVARSQILTESANVDLAHKIHTRQVHLHESVKLLANKIRGGESIDSIKREVAGKSLGERGGSLLTAYSQSQLTGNIADSIGSVAGSGAISGRVVLERETQQQQAEASLTSLIEQSLFDTQRAMQKTEADLQRAERELRIAKQTLDNLIAATPGSIDGLDISPDDPDVSKLTITSPIEGTIESKTFSSTERVSAGDELYVIADTTHLWVEADMRGRDWDRVAVSAGDAVMVTTPSVDLPTQTATVLYIGRQVDPASGAIPLVASIENPAGHFRPGLFTNVQVPTQTLHQVITISESAVVDLNGQDSVFVQRDGGFIAIAVDVGSRSGDRVEIRSGLSEGDSVVVAGAFTLKSEMLLEGEE